jgi:hypothetical protein
VATCEAVLVAVDGNGGPDPKAPGAVPVDDRAPQTHTGRPLWVALWLVSAFLAVAWLLGEWWQSDTRVGSSRRTFPPSPASTASAADRHEMAGGQAAAFSPSSSLDRPRSDSA